jgi:hypothetical protein
MIIRALLSAAVVIAVATNIAAGINATGRNPFAPRCVPPEPASIHPDTTAVQPAAAHRVENMARQDGSKARPFSPEMYRP